MTEKESKTVPCRYCKHEVEKGIRRCPYCGTHNPSMNVKQAFVWTVSGILFLYLLAFVLQSVKG